MEGGIRRFPLVEVTLEQIEWLVSRLGSGHSLRSVERVQGGLTNTIFRVRLTDGDGALLVRIFSSGRAKWEKERAILGHLQGRVPVPEVLLADDGTGRIPYPCLVLRWVEGVTLNALRRLVPTSEVLQLAAPLGVLVAQVSAVSVPASLGLGRDAKAPASSVESFLSTNEERLLRGRARTRLGGPLADALWAYLSTGASALLRCRLDRSLVHGDFGGRNVILAAQPSGAWRIAALLDWEEAFAGWSLWDVGSLFRYRRRYDEAFRAAFEEGHRAAGGTLPEGWWRTARLLDASRQTATLAAEGERPEVFAECCDLLKALIEDDA